MSDLISDGTSFKCMLCSAEMEISVSSSSVKGDSKNLATEANFTFPPKPGAQCLLNPSVPIPCTPILPPYVSVIDPGQSGVKIDGAKALASGCKLQCCMSGLVSMTSSGQSVVQCNPVSGGDAKGMVLAAAVAGAAAQQDAEKPEEKKEEKKLSAANRNKENKRRDGAPKNNQAQNKQFKGAVKDIEKKIDKKLTHDNLEVLHDEITGKNLSYHEIVEVGVDLFQ